MAVGAAVVLGMGTAGCGPALTAVGLQVPGFGVLPLPAYPGAAEVRAPLLPGLPCYERSPRTCPARTLAVKASEQQVLARYQDEMTRLGYEATGPGYGPHWEDEVFQRDASSTLVVDVWVTTEPRGPNRVVVELAAIAQPPVRLGAGPR